MSDAEAESSRRDPSGNADWIQLLTQAARHTVLSQRSQRHSRRRYLGQALCALGAADALYMLLHQTGALSRLPCPFFGDGCEKISRSKQMNPLGLPGALFGLMGFGGLIGLLGWGPEDRYQRYPERVLASAAAAAALAATSVGLNVYQRHKLNALCFWCLLSATTATALVPLLAPEVAAAWRHRESETLPQLREAA